MNERSIVLGAQNCSALAKVRKAEFNKRSAVASRVATTEMLERLMGFEIGIGLARVPIEFPGALAAAKWSWLASDWIQIRSRKSNLTEQRVE
jgi:hypothetical protein